MERPRICAVIVDNDLEAVKRVEPFVDLFEVRIDLIGGGWQELVKQLNKPWIGCNRRADEGGSCQEDDASRVKKLFEAAKLGARIIDLELRTENLEAAVRLIKQRAKCLISFHELKETPPLSSLREMVQKQLRAGADVCKIVTTAQSFEDNLTVLQLISEFSQMRIVSFAMGPLGLVSRVLCPMVRGDFTYASIEQGKESAPGQITVWGLNKLYEVMVR